MRKLSEYTDFQTEVVYDGPDSGIAEVRIVRTTVSTYQATVHKTSCVRCQKTAPLPLRYPAARDVAASIDAGHRTVAEFVAEDDGVDKKGCYTSDGWKLVAKYTLLCPECRAGLDELRHEFVSEGQTRSK